MATLKVCTSYMTHWIADVSEVIELGSFPWTPGEDPAAVWEKREEARGHRGALPNVYTVVGFDLPDEKPYSVSSGKALRITTRHGTFTWFIPSESAYLMSDTGKTIDRM